jgi:hypothetical protein
MSLEARPSGLGNARGPQRPLAHLLLVAGARGAGKTTFIQAVQSGRTDPAILACLPRNTAHWPTIEAWQHTSWIPRITTTDEKRIPRLILHCDLVTMKDASVGRALDVVKLARKVTAVNVRPDIARLAVQFSARTSGQVASIAIGERVLNTGPADQAGQVRYAEQMRRTVLELYSEPNWVEQLYAEWNADLIRTATGALLRLVEVQPLEPGPLGEFRWALKYDSNKDAHGNGVKVVLRGRIARRSTLPT